MNRRRCARALSLGSYSFTTVAFFKKSASNSSPSPGPVGAGAAGRLAPTNMAGVFAFIGGGSVARLTDRSFLLGALRQFALAGAAAALTYGIGAAVHATVH